MGFGRRMVELSSDTTLAAQQMRALIFYLVTFGHIDGDFDDREKAAVRDMIATLVERHSNRVGPSGDELARAQDVERQTRIFHEALDAIDENVSDLFSESVSTGEDPKEFVRTRLKVRCFELLQSFDATGRAHLIALVDSLLLADGIAHPAELEFRRELASLLDTPPPIKVDAAEPSPRRVTIAASHRAMPSVTAHPWFDDLESDVSRDHRRVGALLDRERSVIDGVLEILSEQREAGRGRLTGRLTVGEIPAGDAFLDGHVHVRMPAVGQSFELTILGDLHGCYSVLKATILQSRFLERVESYRSNPTGPFPLLVLLGDYIDRGLFGLQGIVRAVLRLWVAAPDHVVVLRGNHEHYIEAQGTIRGGVRPAESIETLRPYLSIETLRRYRLLFDQMPTVFLFDKFLFVHGGIPRERTTKRRWTDLSALNDAEVRFQMLWSDPSQADVIPAALQDHVARFAFGRTQFRAFMDRVGAHTMIRGHERVRAGFSVTYPQEAKQCLTVFSAGGRTNADLPPGSSYRHVTPQALTITWNDGASVVTPWSPDWATFNEPDHNAFFRPSNDFAS